MKKKKNFIIKKGQPPYKQGWWWIIIAIIWFFEGLGTPLISFLFVFERLFFIDFVRQISERTIETFAVLFIWISFVYIGVTAYRNKKFKELWILMSIIFLLIVIATLLSMSLN